MVGGICYRKGYERGIWFEINCVKEVIVNKEAKGLDASLERGLLKTWANYEGWEDAGTPVGSRDKSKI